MYIIDEKFLSSTLTLHARSLVGRICKQNEILSNRNDLAELQKLSLLKDLCKELIYEEMRNLENQIKAYTEGKECLKIYKPTPKE
jgi:hypothetical protein